jgi:hypothetical protein
VNDEDNDLYWLVIGGPVFFIGTLGGVFTWLTGGFMNATQWLVDRNVLAGAEEALVTIGAGGLDLPRLILLAGAVVLFLALLVVSARGCAKRKA